MVTDNKAGVTPRVLNVPLLLQDGSASPLVNLSSNKEASTSEEERLQQHSNVEGIQEDIRMGRAFSPIPLALVDSKAISETVESLSSSRENQTQKDGTYLPISTDVCAMTTRASFVPPKTTVPTTSNTNSQIKRPMQTSSSMHHEAHLSTGFLSDRSNLASNRQLVTIATSSTPQTKDIDLYNHSNRRCTLSTSYASSNARAASKESGSVTSSSSSCQSVVTSALRKLVKDSREQSTQGRKASISSPSAPRKPDPQKESLKSFLLEPSGPREQRLPQKPQLVNSCSGLSSHQGSDLQQRNGWHKSQFIDAPSSLPSNKEKCLNKQLSLLQKSKLTNVSSSVLPRHPESSPQELQFVSTSSSLPSSQTRVISKITASSNESHLSNTSLSVISNHVSQEAQWSTTPSTPPPNRFIRVAPKTSQRTDIQSSLLLPHAQGVVVTQKQNVPQGSQLSTNMPSNPSTEERGFLKPIAWGQSQLVNCAPNIPYRGEGSPYKQTTLKQSHFTNVPFRHPHREASGIHDKSSTKEPQVSNSIHPFADLKQKSKKQSSNQMWNTPSQLPSCQEPSLCDKNPSFQTVFVNCSMERRPNPNLISSSSQMSLVRDSPPVTASFAPTSGVRKCNEVLQTPAPSNTSKEMRSAILKQVVSQLLKQSIHCNEHPPNSLSPHRCLPVALVQTMATHSNSKTDISRKVADHWPNKNINYVTPPLSRQGSSHNTSSDLKNGDHQRIKTVVFRNFPKSPSCNLFTVSQRNDIQRSRVNFSRTQNFNTGSSNGKQDSFQARQLETSHRHFGKEEKTISCGYVDNNNSKNFSKEVMEMYSQSGVYTSSSEGWEGGPCGYTELKKKSSSTNNNKAANRCSSRTAECDPRNSFHHEHCPLSEKQSNLN